MRIEVRFNRKCITAGCHALIADYPVQPRTSQIANKF